MERNNTLRFRTLRPDEVECRVASISEKGLSLLLYKDARVDQNVLDETVGIMNWKREHQMIGDRLYCTVSVWDPDKKQWISKQDVGTESYTEKEKGQASDSFKRACFNLGIGRELYTAPFIWIKSPDCRIVEKSGKKACYDKFRVTEMDVNNGIITALEIRNDSLDRVVYCFSLPDGGTQQKADDERANAELTEQAGRAVIDGTKVKVIRDTIRRKGLSESSILGHYKLKKFEDMTIAHWTNAMNLLERYPDKEDVKK